MLHLNFALAFSALYVVLFISVINNFRFTNRRHLLFLIGGVICIALIAANYDLLSHIVLHW